MQTGTASTQHVNVKKMLVVLICIGAYEGDRTNPSKLSDLSFTSTNKQNMIELFRGKYNYDIMTNKNDTFTLLDYENMEDAARTEFRNGDYDGIIFIYSGHGERGVIKFSDYKDEDDMKGYQYREKYRSSVESAFNGNCVANKIDKYKIFLMDACRGSCESKLIKPEVIGETKGNPAHIGSKQAEANRIILSSNPVNFEAYDIPNKGGVLLSGLYDIMMNDDNNDKSFGEVIDLMKDNVDHEVIDVKADEGESVKRTSIIDMDTTMKISDMLGLYFRKNENENSKKKWIERNKENKYDFNILYL